MKNVRVFFLSSRSKPIEGRPERNWKIFEGGGGYKLSVLEGEEERASRPAVNPVHDEILPLQGAEITVIYKLRVDISLIQRNCW